MRPSDGTPKKRGGNVRNARTTHPLKAARRARAAGRVGQPPVGWEGMSPAELYEAQDLRRVR